MLPWRQIRIELSGLDLAPSEQKELMEIAEKQLHHVMLNVALSQIKGEDKKVFLSHVAKEDHEKSWELLRKHSRDIEQYLMHAAHSLYEELRADIRDLKKKK